jgi:phage-related minor tail protein
LESQVITDFVFLEKHHKVPYPEEMRLVFVELPKFNKKLRQLKGMADKWIYFVKNVGHLKSIPKTLANDKDINQALSIANTTSLTPKELELQDKKLRWLWDQKTNLARAEQAEREAKQAERENAKAQKMAQEALDKAAKAEAEKQAVLEKLEKAETEKQAALEKAETEKQAALEKAKKATQLQMAKQMLQAHAEIALIKQVTGLKQKEITQLKNNE